MSVKKLLRKELDKLEAYKAPEFVYSECKLNQNESTLGFPDEIKQQIKREVDLLAFNRYPDSTYSSLREIVARKFKVGKENVIVGNGVDEVLYYFSLAFIEQGDKVVFQAPSFAMYEICANLMGAKAEKVLLDRPTFDLTEKFVNESEKAKATFICSPNNPTGNSLGRKRVKEVAERSGGMVVIDEAYADFAGEDCLDLLENERVVIMRTMSKAYAAAGLRIGFGIACKDAADAMNKVRLPWNLSGLTVRIAEILLQNDKIFWQRVKETKNERARVFSELCRIPSVVVFPSQANFILFKTPLVSRKVYLALLERGVQVRDVSGYELLDKCLRVSIGTRSENDEFLNNLKEVLRGEAVKE